MITLKDITSRIKAEIQKGEAADRDELLQLIDRIEPFAARDWARIKKLERRTEAMAGKSPEEIEKSLADIEELKKEVEQHKNLLAEKEKMIESQGAENSTKLKALQDELEMERLAVERLVLDAGVTSELVNANAKSSLIGAAKALIKEKGILRIEKEGTARRAVAVESREGKEVKRELSDWMKEFLASDEGKEFVSAKPNSGSGAQDGRTGNGEEREGLSSESFWAMPAKERAAYMSKGGTILPE